MKARICSPTAAALVAAGLSAQGALAQPSSAPAPQAQIVITATRVETPAFDVPASVSRVDIDPTRDAQAGVNLSEDLGAVPGLLARDRQNYAQDLQISVRGFGARTTFGVRGVRLYVDGIPATLPDGQGQISNVDLGSAQSVEVLRGPFSALYGNSSGGVIQVFSEEGATPGGLTLSASGGSYGGLRVGAKLSGRSGAFGYVASASRFHTSGYRRHSAAERGIGNLKASWAVDEYTRVSLIGNSVTLPLAQDPMGLTRAQYQADPRGVDPSALSFDTRKSIEQSQGGIIVERRLDASNALRWLVYTGHREATQFQSIPVATQNNALSPGGVIVLVRDYHGTDLRWTWRGAAAGAPLTLVTGVAWDGLVEQRRGFQNFIGATLGVQGALRRDQTNRVQNLDPYVQASWHFAPAWTLDAGVRHSRVGFDSADHYTAPGVPDGSGSVDYRATLPVLGLMHAVNPGLHLYATAGRGFETPTLNELAYRPDGQPGLNFGLQPARSTSGEVGAKMRSEGLGRLDLALFETHTSAELVVLSNSNGRATYQNAGGTLRRGVELSWSKALAADWRAQAAYTYLDAGYRDTFDTCAGTPCAVPTLVVAAGNRIPGLARSALYAALDWASAQGWRAGVEARALDRVIVNDANSDAAAGFALAGVHAGYQLRASGWTLNAFGRIDNLFDRRYAGSVIVGDSNGRYFEPAPGRTWLLGLSAGFEL